MKRRICGQMQTADDRERGGGGGGRGRAAAGGGGGGPRIRFLLGTRSSSQSVGH